MRIEGVQRLFRQLDDLPDQAHDALKRSVERTVQYGVTKARAVAPDVTGEFKSGISGNVQVNSSNGDILGFINFYGGEDSDGVAANSINYGWGNMRYGFETRATVMLFVKQRHARAVSRQLKKAIKEAMNG